MYLHIDYFSVVIRFLILFSIKQNLICLQSKLIAAGEEQLLRGILYIFIDHLRNNKPLPLLVREQT